MAIDAPHPPAVTIVMPSPCLSGLWLSVAAFPKPPQEQPKGRLKKGEAREMFYYNLVVRGVKPCGGTGLQIAQEWRS